MICLAGLACFAPAAFGDSITLIPSADTTIMEVSPSNNNGGLAWFTTGGNHYAVRSRGLLKFDIAGNIPAHSQITSASLDLTVTKTPGDGYAVGYFDLHRLLRNWGEGNKSTGNAPGQGLPASTNEATWLSPLAYTTSWSSPGGGPTNDYAAKVTASQIVFDEIQSPYVFPDPSADPAPTVADIQTWLDTPATNFGWIFICESEDVANTTRRFASREDPYFPPLLSITFNPPPPVLIQRADHLGDKFRLYFTAQAGRAHAVEFRNSLSASGPWNTVTNIPALPATTDLVITNTITGTQGFYRLRTQ
jgi:hypothetical protein